MLGPIAQRLEHLSHKEQVAGSNPAGSTNGVKMEIFLYIIAMSLISNMIPASTKFQMFLISQFKK